MSFHLKRPAPPLERASFALQTALALCCAYLLGLLLAAGHGRRRAARGRGGRERPLAARRPGPSRRLRMAVLVPAHDEQDGIPATLDSLARCEYPRERFQTIVIADNCTDATAQRARQAGVEVWERFAPERRGKGQALAWATERLRGDARAFDAVVVLDADCTVSPNLLGALDATLRGGASAAQVTCRIANPGASDAAALRYAAYALMNTVRPLGKRRLGLSCGLFGTGMALRSGLLERIPWSATGLAEDGEYHLRLVDAGERVEFVPQAWVSSPLPTSLARSKQQQARWEKGRLQLLRRWSPRLLRSGIARGDPVRVHAGLEHLVPPQSLIAVGSLLSMTIGLLAGSRRLLLLAAGALAAQLSYVLGGLWLVGAPTRAYRALAVAPLLMIGKVALYARLLLRRGPDSWVRTERSPAPTTVRDQ